MKTKFKHLTPGYCGYQQQELTLNSYFYGYIFSQPDLLKKNYYSRNEHQALILSLKSFKMKDLMLGIK